MRTLALAAALLFVSAAAHAGPLPPQADYAKPDAWLCRSPNALAVCVKDLDALGFDAMGKRIPEPPFRVDQDAKVDCFYVYPTASEQTGPYANPVPEPSVNKVAHAQAGRFASVCRLYVPLYRQLTLPALFAKPKKPLNFDVPYEDVKAAWTYYMAHENHGRGVILIGHSQGTILLQRLMVEEIDGKPEQNQLVLALLGGNPGLSIPDGKLVGGTFKSIPVCHVKGEPGCALVWSSYAADDVSTPIFGRGRPGDTAACTNPARIGGGAAPLKGFVPKAPIAPPKDPPYVEQLGQLAADCVTDKGGATLRIHVEPGIFAGIIKQGLANTSKLPGWGLHALDYSLTQGDLIDDVEASSATWIKLHP